MWSWMRRAATALRAAVRQQQLALVLAWAATRAPLVGQPKPVSLGPVGRWAGASLPLAQQHPLVRLALWWRTARLARLALEAQPALNRAQRRALTRSRKSTG